MNKHKQEFPDYPTILAVVRSTNEDFALHLPEDTVSMLGTVLIKIFFTINSANNYGFFVQLKKPSRVSDWN